MRRAMSRKMLIACFIVLIAAMSASSAYGLSVYLKEGDVYVADDSAAECRLTFLGNNSEPRLSPDGKKIIFVRYKKEDVSKGKNNLSLSARGPFPADHDAIWSMDADGGAKRMIVKNYYSGVEDASKYLCSFEHLAFAPDGKYIYFLAKPAHNQGRAVFCRAGIDGADVRTFPGFNEFDGVVGGDTQDKYHGDIVVYQRKHSEDGSGGGWLAAVIDPDGKILEKIEMGDLDKFWQEHKKVS